MQMRGLIRQWLKLPFLGALSIRGQDRIIRLWGDEQTRMPPPPRLLAPAAVMNGSDPWYRRIEVDALRQRKQTLLTVSEAGNLVGVDNSPIEN